ncbi:hypothetical protein [Gemmobacter aquatilis]|nr:hypothetical protein [Gemmobacter aquatilis]
MRDALEHLSGSYLVRARDARPDANKKSPNAKYVGESCRKVTGGCLQSSADLSQATCGKKGKGGTSRLNNFLRHASQNNRYDKADSMSAGYDSTFAATHRRLLDLYRATRTAGPDALHQDILPTLQALRDNLVDTSCTASLVSYERYLDLFALLLRNPGLKARLTLLDAERFETALRLDPARPVALIGAGLAWLDCGNTTRGLQLLSRLAASRQPEYRIAQHLLRQNVAKAAQA